MTESTQQPDMSKSAQEVDTSEPPDIVERLPELPAINAGTGLAWQLYTADQMRTYAAEAVRAALAERAPESAQPVALWQFRHLNETEWKEVKPWNPRMQTLEQRIEELQAFRYKDQPVYEVRALYTHPAPEALATAEAARPAQAVEIDYAKLVADCYKRTKAAQGTRGCVQFKAGAEWFREQVLAATPAPATTGREEPHP